MSSANDQPKISLKSGLSAWLRKMGVPLIVALEIVVGATQSNSLAANPPVRMVERTISLESDDQTFSPTAKISASVGKGGKNEKQDVLLVERLLSKFGYELALNGEADAALNSAIGKFQAVYVPTTKSDERIDPAGQTWNTLIGIGRVKGSLDELAKKYDLEPAVILAIQSVESGNNGYLPDGRPKILFEGHVFWRMLKAAGKNPADFVKGNEDILFEKQDRSKYTRGAAEYVRLEKAEKIDRVAALKSASWGEFQIMGFNHKTVGYPDVDSFVESIKQPGAGQIRAVLSFMDNNKLLPLVRGPRKNWAKFAAAYNGAGYQKNQYDVKLQKAYDRFSKISTKEATKID
jgi:N-acetylmuramidase